MNNEKKKQTEKERQNKIAFIGNMLAAVVYTYVFICELQLSGKSIVYFIIALLLTWSPVFWNVFFWKKDHESPAIKHILAGGFAVLYTFATFTVTNAATYAYVFPMLLIVAVFNDTKYITKIISGVIVLNLISAIGGITTGKFGFVDTPQSVIQIISSVIMSIAAYFVMKALEENAEDKLEDMAASKGESDKLLKRVTRLTEKMTDSINEINIATDSLQEASSLTQEAMEEVSEGANDTAEAVQQQLIETQAIQDKIEEISEETDSVSQNMHETLTVLKEGKADIGVLVQKVDDSVELGVNVTGKLETLDEYIEKMNTIVGIISGITSQTSLLALNASIEAARAGEAGKGFAVVAGEISDMATQTKDATVNITELINGVSVAISEVVSDVREMIQGINDQKESAESTVVSFGKIEENTYSIQENVDKLTNGVKELEVSNREISDVIQRISAISEELTARANETADAGRSNADNIELISSMVSELSDLANQD